MRGATHGLVFNAQGDKLAWIELDEDDYGPGRQVADSWLFHELS